MVEEPKPRAEGEEVLEVRTRYWLKPCPNCRGGLLEEQCRRESWHITCSLCGYRLSSNEMRVLISDMVAQDGIQMSTSAAGR